MSFFTKCTPKKVFPVEKRTSNPGATPVCFLLSKLKFSTVVFKHFEDLKDLIILNILKEKLVCLASWALIILKSFSNSTVQIDLTSKVMIQFWSKFQFQIPLQFYRTVHKVETCDGNGQKSQKVPPSFPSSNFAYFFVFSWLRFKHTDYKGTLT